jgi:hypothetical protein
VLAHCGRPESEFSGLYQARRYDERNYLPHVPPRYLTLIKAAVVPTPDARTSIHSRGAGMSTIDMFYLGLVVAAFLGFAVALAYYSHR